METWDDELRERRRARAAVRHLWQKYGITYQPVVMVVYAMVCAPTATYDDVLETLTLYMAQRDGLPPWPVERWHSEICYRLLKAGMDTGVSAEEWLRARAKEVRELED